MLQLVKYKRGHLLTLMNQPELAYLSDYMTPESDLTLEQAPFAHTVLKNGQPLLCAGVHQYWANRGEAWAVFNQSCREEFLAIHNIVRRYLDDIPVTRVEAVVDAGFRPGHRWVLALGFTPEASRMVSYRPNGNDAVMYARIKK